MHPAISIGGSSSSTMRAASSWKAAPAGLSGRGARRARLRRRADDRGLDRDLRDERRPDLLRQCGPATRSEEREALAVGRDELRHVLDHSDDLHVRPARHVGDTDRDALRGETRCRDDEHLGLREHAGEPHLDVAGARRHVDQQIVELAPADVGEELLERLREHEPAPHERGALVVDEEAHRHDLELAATGIVLAPSISTTCGSILPSAPPRRPSTPNMRGTLKPQMSASRTPTRRPRAASAAARFTVTDDLPTPPFPLATASTRSWRTPRSVRRPRAPGSAPEPWLPTSAPGSSRRSRR